MGSTLCRQLRGKGLMKKKKSWWRRVGTREEILKPGMWGSMASRQPPLLLGLGFLRLCSQGSFSVARSRTLVASWHWVSIKGQLWIAIPEEHSEQLLLSPPCYQESRGPYAGPNMRAGRNLKWRHSGVGTQQEPLSILEAEWWPIFLCRL